MKCGMLYNVECDERRLSPVVRQSTKSRLQSLRDLWNNSRHVLERGQRFWMVAEDEDVRRGRVGASLSSIGEV